jgi:hypothetical protein
MANPTPQRDGHVLVYEPVGDDISNPSKSIERLRTERANSELLKQLRNKGSSSAHKVSLIYVNGMQTTIDTHRDTAELIATMTSRPIEGVYNLTGNAKSNGKEKIFGADLMQSVQDYVNPVGRGRVLTPFKQGASSRSGIFPAQQILSMAAGTVASVYRYATAEGEDYINLLRAELAENVAGLTLFNLLLNQYWYSCGFRKTVIIAHSQGNLITANVIWCLLRAFAPKPLPAQLKVIGLASPNPSWPTSGERNFQWRTFNDRRDPVSWLANVPEMAGGAAVGLLSPIPGSSVQIAAAGFEASRNSGGSRDVQNKSQKTGPTLDAHEVDHYLLTNDFIREMTQDLS